MSECKTIGEADGLAKGPAKTLVRQLERRFGPVLQGR